MPYDINKMPAVANAAFTATQWSSVARYVVSGGSMKAVLWTLWVFEGEEITHEAIADRAGVSIGCVYQALAGLVRLGVVLAMVPGENPRRRSRARIYRISTAALEELRGDTPLCKRKRRKAG